MRGIPSKNHEWAEADQPLSSTPLLFDVNETLLDLSPLGPAFQELLGDSDLRATWFSQMLELSFTGAVTGDYISFPEAQRAALEMLSRRRGVNLSEPQLRLVMELMSALPPHPDVPPALERLRAAGFRLAALTNSPVSVAEAQLTTAGVRGYFDKVLSADQVRRLKPAPEPYLMAAAELGVSPSSTILIAAHPWDVTGAMSAGCRAIFIARQRRIPSPWGRQPELVVSDCLELADRLRA